MNNLKVIRKIAAIRFPANPLISFASSASLGNNINGPSVIKVPAWINKPLGKYYMYFAHHCGSCVRLAYSDNLCGPWMVHEPGTLQLDEAKVFRSHVGSPDVHVNTKNHQIIMYCHGVAKNKNGQWTSIAFSDDGLSFNTSDLLLGKSYFRVFEYNNCHYAVAKDWNSGWGLLYHSEDGLGKFEPGPPFIENMRHCAVKVSANNLLVFFSRKGDAPERILLSMVDLSADWHNWTASEPIEVIRPQRDYEGINFPNMPSEYGSATGVQQLRDPCIFTENGKTYLFYSVAGEEGIAGAELDIVFQS